VARAREGCVVVTVKPGVVVAVAPTGPVQVDSFAGSPQV
jgi:hypothetical protein